LSAATAVRTILKVFFLLLLIIVIILGGIYWFDHLGLIDYKKIIGPLGQYLPSFMQRGEVVEDDPYLLERELLNKQEEVLTARYDELETRTSELEQKELELKEIESKLTEESKRLDEEKKVLSEKQSEYDNYRENIAKQAEYFTSMPPDAAVERLAQLNDLLVIDILRQIDSTAEEEGRLSVVPYFLSLMDPKKAAEIQRKMTKIGDTQE
jgi:flagellar protein FlbB